MSEPTCRAQCYSGEGCISNVRVCLPGTVLQWCRLFKRCKNLPAGHCVTVVKAVLAMSESTCRTLCYSDAGCLSNVRNYLPGTVMQGCRLFKRCQNLPAGHCVTVVKAALAMSEPTCQALCCRGADCWGSVGTYQVGTVLQGCRLFKRCRNLPAVHCVTVVKAVLAMSEPTCRALCCRGADCLSSVETYQVGTVFQWCRLFKQCLNLPAEHCVTVVQTV